MDLSKYFDFSTIDYGSLELNVYPLVGKVKSIKDSLDSYFFKDRLQGQPTKLQIVDDSTFLVASSGKNEA